MLIGLHVKCYNPLASKSVLTQFLPQHTAESPVTYVNVTFGYCDVYIANKQNARQFVFFLYAVTQTKTGGVLCNTVRVSVRPFVRPLQYPLCRTALL